MLNIATSLNQNLYANSLQRAVLKTELQESWKFSDLIWKTDSAEEDE
jgi:hypothetical protein